MYLVELRPGKEELYRTSDDLAAAIRRGDVDVHSRIYHRATSKWISITLHPHYKAIITQKSEPLPPPPASTPVERAWTYLNAQSETLRGADTQPDVERGRRVSQPGGAVVDGTSAAWRRLFALSVAGLALLFGVQLAFFGPRPPWADRGATRTAALPATVEDTEPARDEQVVSLATTSGDWEDDESLPSDAASGARTGKPRAFTPALPRAPSLRLKALGDALPDSASVKAGDEASAPTVEGLLARYTAAHESALDRLAAGVRVARLTQLLASSRLTPDGGVTTTRLGLAGVANFIRVFRQQQEQIEQEYQDSFATLARENAWTTATLKLWQARPRPKEPPALTSLSSHLVFGIDSVLAILTEQAGAYRLGEGTIAFEDVGASRRYSRLRRKVTSIIDSARVAGAEETAGPTNLLLEAIGSTRLPREI